MAPHRQRSALLTVASFAVIIILAFMIQYSSYESLICLASWSVAQWMMPILPQEIHASLLSHAWEHWEERYSNDDFDAAITNPPIPVVHVQGHLDDLVPFLEETHGMDWRRRPLLLKGLWSQDALSEDPSSSGRRRRRLSLSGLLRENLTVPFFTDARIAGALSPDDRAPVKDIVANISNGGIDAQPHKIGTQLLVQTYPDLINEVAPLHIVTDLFGNYFTEDHVKGSGPFRFLPALTTVPIFVANGAAAAAKSSEQEDAQRTGNPYTALHCEPIGNVAVQLSGRRRWTLIRPQFSYLIKPSAAPDGRAFFASWASQYDNVPAYSAVTEAGDAVWIPTWTWHRVDYEKSPKVDDDDDDDDNSVSIGGSLFHFRPVDFVRNNPFFAVLIIPALLLELVGYSTQ